MVELTQPQIATCHYCPKEISLELSAYNYQKTVN